MLSPETFKIYMHKIFEDVCCLDLSKQAAIELMCDFLEGLGFNEGIKIYRKYTDPEEYQ